MHGSAAINPDQANRCSNSDWNNVAHASRVGWTGGRLPSCNALPLLTMRLAPPLHAPSHAAHGGIGFAQGQSNASPSTPEVVRP